MVQIVNVNGDIKKSMDNVFQVNLYVLGMQLEIIKDNVFVHKLTISLSITFVSKIQVTQLIVPSTHTKTLKVNAFALNQIMSLSTTFVSLKIKVKHVHQIHTEIVKDNVYVINLIL